MNEERVMDNEIERIQKAKEEGKPWEKRGERNFCYQLGYASFSHMTTILKRKTTPPPTRVVIVLGISWEDCLRMSNGCYGLLSESSIWVF